MSRRKWLQVAATLGVSLSIVGCGSSIKTVKTTVTPPATPPGPVVRQFPPPALDPVAALIAESQRHFADGEREVQQGHLEQARTAFNLSVDVLLQSPYGARLDPRIRQHFDRIVERISAYEVAALAQGDGFVEKEPEPASIDELLAIASVDKPLPTTELQNTVETDLSHTMHDVDIPLNSKVLSYIELFQGNLHEWFDRGLRRGSRYLPMIQDEFRRAGLPLDLSYVPLVESAFNANALSRAKAKGLWQFMRATGLEHGLDQNWYIDERSDPEKATKAAAKYLKTLGGMFDGDWHLALASYNGGPGRVQRAIKQSNEGDFWSLTATSKYLPRETREYVPMILAAMVIARNPAQYGFSIASEEPLSYEKVTISAPIDLRRVAEWTGAPIDEIQALNPELRRWTTPVQYPNYEMKVPVGTGDPFRARLSGTSPESLTTLQWHVVKKGETLLSISRSLKVKQADLAEANYLALRARINIGQRLIIPRAPTTLMAGGTEIATPDVQPASSRPVAAGKPSTAATSARPTEGGGEPHRVLHRVKPGDTLFSLARLYNTTVASIQRWNARLIRWSQINVGDRLTIFAARSAN